MAMLFAAAGSSQCALCYRTAQALSAARGRVLNSGILVLGTPPLLILAGFGILIHRRNRGQ